MGAQETVQTSDAPVEAVITRGNTGKTEAVSSAPQTPTATAVDPADTLTGLVVLGLAAFILFKFLRG